MPSIVQSEVSFLGLIFALEIYRNTAFYEEPPKKIEEKQGATNKNREDSEEETKSNLKDPKPKYMNKASMLSNQPPSSQKKKGCC